MKKKTTTKRLSLSKETVVHLEQVGGQGGESRDFCPADNSAPASCGTTCPPGC
jgi:hypothetical protein